MRNPASSVGMQRISRQWGGVLAMAVIGVLAAAWSVAESPTQKTASTLSTPTPAGLPEFRTIVRDNQAAIVRISMSGTQRVTTTNPFQNDDDDANPLNQLPQNSPFQQFFRGFGQQVPQERQVQGTGSGFIISSDGKVLTNAHVVDGADTVTVRLADHREYQAKVLGKDTQTDVALLKIDAKNLPVVKLGNSDQLSVGEWVLAIGSPFGLDYSATQGIVSALGRSLPNETYVPFIQTDAAVNPGNSGGPLFNTRGEVVGINSQIYSNTGSYAGLAFAIPINTVSAVVQQLEYQGHVSRGWLGVQIQDVSSDLAQTFGLDRPRGALVGGVDAEGPAGKAGIQVGDVILSFNGHDIDDSSELPPVVGATPVGTKVDVKVWREGKEVTLRPVLATLQDKTQVASNETGDKTTGKALLNVTVQSLTDEQRKQYNLAKGGVLLTQVNEGPAKRAGLQSGDIVLKVGNQDLLDADQFVKKVRELPRGKPVAFLVQRQQGRLFVAVTLPEKD